MAVTMDELLVKINIQGAEATQEISKLTEELKRLKGSLDKNTKASAGFMDMFTKINLGVFAFAQNVKLGAQALQAFAKPFMDAEDASTRLGFALEQVGNKNIEKFKKSINSLGKEMQKLGIAEDDQVTQLAAVAVASGRTADQIETMVRGAAGINAMKPDTSFVEAFNAMAASFKGNGKALATLAPELTDMTEKAFKAGEGAEYINSKFGPYAQKNLETYGGKINALGFALGDLTEDLGRAVGDAINLPEILMATTAAVTSLSNGLAKLTKFLGSREFALFSASMVAATAAVVAFNFTLAASSTGAFVNGLLAIRAAAVKMLVPFAGFIGVAAGIATVAAAVDVLVKNFTRLGDIIAAIGGAGMDTLVLGINRAIAAGIRFADLVLEPLSGLPVISDLAKANKKNLEDLDKAAVGLGKSIDKNLGEALEGVANIDTGLFGKAAGWIEEVAYATEEVDKLDKKLGGLKPPTSILGEDAKKAIEELKKLLDDAAKSAASAGLEGVAKIEAEAAAAHAKIDQLAKDIGQGGAVPKEYYDQLLKLRKLTDEAFDKRKVEEFANSQKELERETLALQQNYNSEFSLTLDRIEQQLEHQMKLIDLKREELKLNKMLTPEAEAELGKQEAIAKKTAAGQSAKAPGREFEGLQKAGQGIVDSIGGAFTSGAAGMVTGAMSMVGLVVSAVDAMLDFIPNLLNAVAGIFNKITDFPEILFNAFQGLFDSIVRFVQEFIPKLIASIGKSIMQIGNFITGLIKAVINLFKDLPKMIDEMISALPDMIEGFVQSITEALPDLIISFIEFFYQKLPMIAVKLAYALGVQLPISIMKGTLKAFQTIWKRIWAAISGKKLPQIKVDTKAMVNAAKKLSGQASNLFGVSDMTEAVTDPAKHLQKLADKTRDALKEGLEALKKAWMWVYEKILKPILEGLKVVWMWIYNAIVKPIIDGLKAAWMFIYNNILKPIIDLFKGVFNSLMNIFRPIIDLFKNVFNSVGAIFQPVIELFKTVFNSVGIIFKPIIDLFNGTFSFAGSILNPIIDSFKAVFNGVKAIFDPIVALLKNTFDGFKNSISGLTSTFTNFGTAIWDGLKKGLDGLGKFFTDMFNQLNPSNLFQKIFKVDMGGKGTVEKALGIDIPFMSFADGGVVPGKALLKGDSLLNDRVIAMVSPGEAIIPRSLMSDPRIRSIVQGILDGNLDVPQFGLKMPKVGGTLGQLGGAVSGAIQDAGKWVGDVLDPLNPMKQLWEEVKDKVFNDMIMKMLQKNRFFEGGIVGSPGFSSPGYVGDFMNNSRPSIGLNNVSAVKTPGGDNIVVNVNVKIDAKTNIDASYIRGTLVPTVKEELKRASLEGQFIISSKGVR